MSADRKVREEPLLPCTAWVRLSYDVGDVLWPEA